MDQERFAQGRRNYRSGNYAQAAQEFLESAEPGIARGNGSAFHQAGNAFLQLGRLPDAMTMYQNALRDDTYDNMSSVYSNIGHVYAKEGKYAESAEAFELAATYPECEKPYKCHLRVAQNHMKLGQIDKAAIAYKKAALDVTNPDRSKALYNLALCLLELKQPLSAVESLKLALDFPDCDSRGKVLQSLGIAYTLLDSDEEAIEAFEGARAVLGEEALSAVASATYATAKSRRMAEVGEAQPLIVETPEAYILGDEDITSLTGEIRSIDTSEFEPEQHTEGFSAIGSAEEVAEFYAMTDDELLEQSKQLAAVDKPPVKWWKVLLGILLALLLVAVSAAGVAYYLGYGYPGASQVVHSALSAYRDEEPVASYWSIPAEEAEEMMSDTVPHGLNYEILTADGQMGLSTVPVIATDADESETALRFNLVRDGLSWRIESVHVALDSD